MFWPPHPVLFYDVDHLNVQGAKIYSEMLAAWLVEQGFADPRPADYHITEPKNG